MTKEPIRNSRVGFSFAPLVDSHTVPKGEYLQYGGQAIIEGVMMRTPRFFAISCRAPNGEIVTTTEAIEKTWIGRQNWLKLPFLRGSLALLDSMALGIRSMKFASSVQLDQRYQKEEDKVEAGKAPSQKVQDLAIAGTMVFALVFGIVLFNLLPNLISATLSKRMNVTSDSAINFTTEIIKAVFFLGYIYLISRLPDIQRVFQYHGAEHKAINTLEAEQELTMENCQAQTRLHPRCGTSFAIVVLIVSIICFTPLPRPTGVNPVMVGFLRFLIEIPLMLIIAGISYELIRFAGKFRSSSLVMALFFPGLMTQYLTTSEPDESQIEVALTALKACIAAEEASKAEKDPEPLIALDVSDPVETPHASEPS